MVEVGIEKGARARRAILDGLLAFNRPHLGRSPQSALVITLRDDKDQIVGGLSGRVRLGWLHVDMVWIAESQRGSGQGRALLVAAEAEAMRRKVSNIYLESYSFQAPGFYKKLGYREFGRLEGFPAGHSTVYLTKAL